MSHNVIMPALGMTQVTGLIVAWHKQPGDAVKAEDILLEVETDKTTMEVEAGHDGFVSAIHAPAGTEIPVGNVIAVLSETKPNAPTGPKAERAEPAPAQEAAPAPNPAAETTPETSSAAPMLRPLSSDGRVLASPKAKRLARERGLDLGQLAAHGVPQPYHVADLEVLAALPTAQMQAPRSHLATLAKEAAFADFMGWLSRETNDSVGRPAVLAAFAAASHRAATGSTSSDITIRTETLASDGGDATFQNPDRVGLAEVETTDTQSTPDLVVRDLTATRMTAMRLGDDTAPVLTVARSIASETYEITLDFAVQALPAAGAIALIDGFTQRVETPLHQLL